MRRNSEIRNPKVETRKKPEIRNLKFATLPDRSGVLFGFRPSEFFRISTFGFRI